MRYLVTIFAVLAVAAIVMLGSRGNESGYYALTSNIKRTDGLSFSSRVLLSGEPVGHIEGMTLRDDYSVNVRILVRRDVKIPVDSAVAIYSESLLRGKYLAILPGGAEEYMKDGDSFEFSQNAINLMRMISAGAEMLKKESK